MRYMVNGLTVNVEEKGMGAPTLVFLHYYGGSSRSWDAVIARLAGRFSCIAPDLRGFGGSDAPKSGYSVADSAADISALVEQLGLKRFVLVGHSMGGKIAQQLASERPKGLKALLLIAPSPPTPEPMTDADRIHMVAAFGKRAAMETTLSQITARPLLPAVRAATLTDNLRVSRAGWVAWPREGSRENITTRVTQVRVPVHVLGGARDPVILPDLLRREVLPRYRGAALTVLPNCGHLLPLEAPDETALWIAERVEAE